jgi:hypothetical protein
MGYSSIRLVQLFLIAAPGGIRSLTANFGTIHQALGVYLLRQFRVDDAWGELSRGIFDSV